MVDANAGQDQLVFFDAFGTNGFSINFMGVSSTTDLGNPFTYDVEVSPAGNSSAVVVNTNNGSLTDTPNGQFATGEGLVITVSNISDPNIVLDGFTAQTKRASSIIEEALQFFRHGDLNHAVETQINISN